MMRELAIQEKDLTLQWQGGNGRLLYVKVKKAKTLEAWVNGQITKENIHEIEKLKIIKNGKAINLAVDTKKAMFKRSSLGEYDIPIFHITSKIMKKQYEKLMH